MTVEDPRVVGQTVATEQPEKVPPVEQVVPKQQPLPVVEEVEPSQECLRPWLHEKVAPPVRAQCKVVGRRLPLRQPEQQLEKAHVEYLRHVEP